MFNPRNCYITPYRVYGLTLLSDVPLPELAPAPQVHLSETCTIRFSLRHQPLITTATAREVMSWALPTGEPWLSCAKFEGGYILRFTNLADFCVDHLGREITCHPTSELLPETLSHLLLDHVIPLALNVRGQDALHATSVLTPHGVCAFTGATGMGKSTLAASFHRAGYSILSDDCLMLKPHRECLIATPAYPGLRLWNDALASLNLNMARPGRWPTTRPNNASLRPSGSIIFIYQRHRAPSLPSIRSSATPLPTRLCTASGCPAEPP